MKKRNIRESEFENYLIAKLLKLYPGAVILKNDPSFLQGIPDRLMLFEDRWIMFEVKNSDKAKIQPNQEYYIDLFNKMSFASIVYPENERRFLDGIQRSLQSKRFTRIFES